MTPSEPTPPGIAALEAWGLARCPLRDLRRLEPQVATLSAAFTAERPEAFVPYLDTQDALTAYALAFAPQTYARVSAALAGILARLPARPKRPLRVLDLGCGLASASLAAKDLLGPIEPTCVDWSESALTAVKELLPEAKTLRADLRRYTPEGPYDLIIASFAVNECWPDPQAAAAALRRWADALATDAPAFILLLEPADRASVPRLHALRGLLPDLPLYAPCPHRGPCPLNPVQDGVCHDVRRFRPDRPLVLLCRRLRRTVSDVKYALLAFGRPGGPQAEGFGDPDFLRLIGPVDKGKGVLACRVCMGDGAVRRLELPTAALPAERRHALLQRQRGDCAWLDGPLDARRQVALGAIQRAADLRFPDDPPPALDDLDDFSFSV